jgi:heat shock protein HslJ
MRIRTLRPPGLSVALITLVVIAAACGQSGSGGASGATASYAGTWILTEGRGPGGEVSLVEGYRITLDIQDNDLVSGTAACNTYDGEIGVNGDSFSFKGFSMTDMDCDPPVMDSEATYIDALWAADAIAREEDRLVLKGPDTELRFELLPPAPTAELIDTVWRLESLIEGTGPAGLVSSARAARLILRSDGTLSGSTGCRDMEGKWTERGDEILFTDLAAEGRCSAELRRQDGHVLNVLGDGFTAEIEGETLTVLSKGGQGLQYRAASTE